MDPAISIVIPVFNGELYLEETIKSLQNQTFTDFEIVFVDDSSTDSSVKLLEHFAQNDNRIKIFQKPNGGTAAKAVNYGLAFARGKYFMYSSQDDIFSVDLLEKNYAIATDMDADAVVPDMILFYGEQNYGKKTVGIEGDRSQVIDGRKGLILSLDWTIHGFVMWRMETVKQCGFYEFGINSDEFTTRVLYYMSNRIAFSEGIFYYRQNNINAITKKWNIRQLECFDTSVKLEEFLLEKEFSEEAIALANKIIFIDLIRVQLMFLDNRRKMAEDDIYIAKEAIKNIYESSLSKIRALKYTSLKHKIMHVFVSANYNSFIAFVAMYRKFLSISNGR